MSAPALGSLLLGSTDPVRLRAWYEKAFGTTADQYGFVQYGDVGVLIDRRDDIAARSVEGTRVILNFHVDDATGLASHLDSMGVTWVMRLESRPDGLFGTFEDPDGNVLQIIELSASYKAARGQ